jgi:hypothetical protein
VNSTEFLSGLRFNVLLATLFLLVKQLLRVIDATAFSVATRKMGFLSN